ncbi:hypothetical protein LDJ79_08385 [Vibrio tritonius]|uniref:Beta-carotene 15,15'-monooxygenase n=1 Tax=Vibrio tritonius TaxID=1435069 RepID=A0ABS7YKB7_9VIBR|nr:hypothetical protein [Vibrio tritonius]MCA2016125.1 hypothetical protein [Vibrio tritonius]
MYKKNHIKAYLSLIILGVIGICLFSIDASAHDAYSTVVLDSTYRTPPPPNELFQQNAEHVFIATTVMLFIAIIFMVVATRDSFKFKSTVPLAMVLGAAFCVVPEAIDNYIAGCYWSQSHDPDLLLFFLMGREFDYYVGIMWWAFGAILGYLLYAVLLRKVTTGTLWICLALSGIADIILEEILLGYGGIYTYFGHQPLVLINNFPWWWLFANVSALFLSVAIAYRYRSWFNGWKSVFILLLMPFCYIGAFTLAGMPAIFAIQGNFSPFVTELLGITTCVISLIQTGLIMNLILGLNPLKLKDTSSYI